MFEDFKQVSNKARVEAEAARMRHEAAYRSMMVGRVESLEQSGAFPGEVA